MHQLIRGHTTSATIPEYQEFISAAIGIKDFCKSYLSLNLHDQVEIQISFDASGDLVSGDWNCHGSTKIPFPEFLARLKGEWKEEEEKKEEKRFKPHQLKNDHWCKTTIYQKAKIAKAAVFAGIFTEFTNYENENFVAYIRYFKIVDIAENYIRETEIPYQEFIARMKGEWIEEKPKEENRYIVDVCDGMFDTKYIKTGKEKLPAGKYEMIKVSD